MQPTELSPDDAFAGAVIVKEGERVYPGSLADLQALERMAPYYREATIRQVDPEARTAVFPFSSQASIERWFYTEILDHGPGAANLLRLNDGGQVLVNHDVDQVVGVTERAWIQDRQGWVRVRFGQSDYASEIFRDVVDGIRRNVSFAYMIREIETEEREDGELIVYVRAWEALEVSIVSVPADATVGIGRDLRSPNPYFDAMPNNHLDGLAFPFQHKEKAKSMEPTQNQPETAPAQVRTEPPVDVDAIKRQTEDQVKKEAAKRAAEIVALGRKFAADLPADAVEVALRDGTSVADFRGQILDAQSDKSTPVTLEKPEAHLDLTRKERQHYSLLRGIQSLIKGEDGFEAECSRTLSERLDKSTDPRRGLLVPTDILIEPMNVAPEIYRHLVRSQQMAPWSPNVIREMALARGVAARDLDAGTATGAAELVGTDHLGASFIELLRARMMVRRLGAQILDGLRGNVSIPRQSASGAAAFVAEGGNTPKNELQTSSVTLSPKTLGNRQTYTRRLLLQSSPSIEVLVRNDLIWAVALAADQAAINGAGGNAPTGILGTAGIGDVSHGDNGGAPTWPTTVALETALTAANADQGSMGYLTTPKARGKYKTTEKASNTAQFIWPDVPMDVDGLSSMNGYRAGSSTQVPSNLTKGTGTGLSANIFANWADALFGEWGVLELLLDPYTGSENAKISIQAWHEMDFTVRRPASFAAAKDIVTT